MPGLPLRAYTVLGFFTTFSGHLVGSRGAFFHFGRILRSLATEPIAWVVILASLGRWPPLWLWIDSLSLDGIKPH